MALWTEQEKEFLKNHYPIRGLKWCAAELKRSNASIRTHASKWGFKQNRNSEFFKDWQRRAGQSKIGKKRPDQAAVIKANWANGKFIYDEERRKRISVQAKKRIAQNGHPRGMLGKKHSAEAKAKFSVSHKKRWLMLTEEQKMDIKFKMMKGRIANGTYAPNYSSKRTWKAAWREFGGKKHFYRSRWEANYGRYLEFLKLHSKIKDWLHEPDIFWFEGVKRGSVSYLPDFKIINNDDSIEYHEVKGWMDARSKTKISRMAKYHPSVKLIVIQKKEYDEILCKLARSIPGWE